MPTWYPSGLVRLIVLLDDGRKDPPEYVAALNEPTNPGVGPASVGGSGTSLSVQVAALPKSVTITRAGIKEADKASIVIDSTYLPIDPRTIRSLACDIYLGVIDPVEFGEGMETGDSRRSVVQSNRENLRFRGWADDGSWSVSEGEFTCELRDFKALLLDSKLKASILHNIDLDRDLLSVVYDIVQACPMTAGMSVSARGIESETDIPLVGATLPEQMTKVVEKAKGKKAVKGKHLPIEEGAETYWGLIERLCLMAGWIPTVDIDTVVLQPPRTLWRGASEQDVYQVTMPGRTYDMAQQGFRRTVAGEALSARRVVWGSDLDSLTLTRPWGDVARKPVQARCWVPGTATLLTSRYPAEATAAKVAPSGKSASEEIDTIFFDGVTTQAALDAATESAWHSRARQELKASFTTHDLASWGGTSRDSDLLDVKGGDTVEIRIAAEGGSSAQLLEGLSRPRLIEYLRSHGMDQKTAEAWAQVQRGRVLPSFFMVMSAQHNFDSEGYSLQVELGAYLQAGD